MEEKMKTKEYCLMNICRISIEPAKEYEDIIIKGEEFDLFTKGSLEIDDCGGERSGEVFLSIKDEEKDISIHMALEPGNLLSLASYFEAIAKNYKDDIYYSEKDEFYWGNEKDIEETVKEGDKYYKEKRNKKLDK